MAAPNSDNVTYAKPKVTGAIFVDLTGDAVAPTDATTALATGFTALGYITDDGAVISRDSDSNDTNAWGGDLVLHTNGGKTTTIEFTMIEQSEDVARLVFDPDNVTVDSTTGNITISDKGWNDNSYPYVIDTILKDGRSKRHYIPKAIISGIDDETLDDSDPDGYDTTLTCMRNADGEFHKIYIGKAVSGS